MAIAHYFKCDNCSGYFVIQKRAKRYCTRKCRDAAYYKRKVKK